MAKECSICRDTQCLNLEENPIHIKDNICDVCKNLSYNEACAMCQLRLSENKTFSVGIYWSIFVVLILITVSLVIMLNLINGPLLRL